MFTGYNGCLVAYGQSASGKTYTMMGTKEDPGLIPRLCEGILSRVEQESSREKVHRVTVSYLEIYNERVRDLLKPSTSASGLRVREHPRLGPYVQGLTRHVVRTLGSLMSYVEEGTKARKTASTLQNPSSSRSHALLTLDLSQETSEAERPGGGDTTSSSRKQDTNPRNGGSSSRLHLVDLAGSESAATCGGVHRLKEGANINKSLVALGNVISALVERGSTGSGPGKRYIPYRDSSLTWLLKDALGGNATTIMLATISPASGSYNETAHTLRFAQRAQSVVNRPVVNEDPVARLIRDLRAEVARLKSLLSEKIKFLSLQDIETKVPCCCGKAQASKDSSTGPEDHEAQESLGTKESDRKDESERSKSDPRSFEVFPIRRFNSSDSVTTCETGSSGSIRKFNSYEHLQSPDRFAGSYNRAKVTEINDEEDEVVDEINEPVFVDIPTLVAVLIKPDDSLHESSARIEEICSDEVQDDADFIEAGNEYEEPTRKLDDDDRSNSTNSCNVPDDQEINEIHQISSECSPAKAKSVERGKSRGKLSKQSSIDLLSNLNVSRKFGSIEGISRSKEPTLALQRSHTNLEKRPALLERGKKLNNIREIDDRKASGKSGVWRAIGNVGSKDHLQRKSSNESDKSLKESNSSRAAGYAHSIGRKPSLESLKRKTSKDSSSSSSKEEQILISSLTRDKLLRRKNSLDHEVAAAGGARHHTAIQRVKRAEIVAAVTERLYSSRKHTEESNMASNSASGTRSPPEGTDVKVTTGSSSISSLTARSRLQEISRKMLLKRRRINVETQTEAASTLRFRDAASLTEEPKVVLQDAAMLTDDHADYVMQDSIIANVTDHRLSVLRVKDAATLTDRRPRADIFRCKDAESLTTDLDFEEYESHSPRNDSGVLSDDTQNYAESNPSEVSEHFSGHPEGDRRVLCTDSSTNTFLTSPARNSAVQTRRPEVKIDQSKASSESRSCGHCCSLMHEAGQRASASSPERNVISISLPDMISITIESTNGLESKIAVVDGTEVAEEKPKLFNDKESQTDEYVRGDAEKSSLTDLTLKSTATQADGRVFRIENIFEDPKSKSCHEATADLRREAATKKSVTFRNSLGTSSVVGTKETGTETEWERLHEDACHRKRAILKDGLARAFIARRRSHSSSPRRPTHRLVRRDLWKNWTLPGRSSGFIDYGRETRTVLSSGQRNTNLGIINNLSSRESNECMSVDKIPKEPSRELLSGTSRSDLKKTKVASTNSLVEYNFSDDSLDDHEDNVARKLTDAETTNSLENHENLCPPDVVAHTKREASKSANHVDLANVESLMDDDFDDTEVEFPRRKSTEVSSVDPMQDYKALILGLSSNIADSDSEEELNAITTPDSKKKVSFSDPSSPEEITDVMINRTILAPKQDSETALKSIIKKMMKPVVSESLDILQPNRIEINQSLQRKKVDSTKSEEISSTKKDNTNSEDSKKPFDNKKVEFPNKDRSEESYGKTSGNISGTTCSRPMPKRNIFEEYLNEATTFMRNMNSINEYMSATSVLESYGKHRRKRGAHRGNNLSANKNLTEIRERRVSPGDDADAQSEQKGTAVESYEKCLKSIKRLEACIDKVGRHNQVLRDRYGIDVESAGAKSGLACSSLDSRMPVVMDNSVIRRYGDAIAGNDVEGRGDELRLSRISSPSSSSTQAEDTRRFTLNEMNGYKMASKIDERDDGSNDVTPEDDLERRIFDQLMCAADSSCEHWSQRFSKPRQRRFWKSDFRSRSPTTYSKFRETFRRDGRGILNSDEVSVAGDYPGDTRGIESSPWSLRRARSTKETGNADSRISSIDPAQFRDQLLRETDDPLEIRVPMEYHCLADPVESIGTDQTSCAEEEIVRRDTQESKDSLRIESSLNLRFGGPLNIGLKYPGSPRAKFLELLRERRRIVENSRGTNAF
ncbi:Kinesin-like protein KIF16B [Ooceraea biroi]|uniref:Kinesin-like protein KIF16B n=1 Tax=Ooceraea biroi TaxID=2015173 RepID=A0A026WIF6_OOCBI|nr:Kinesin-like protein KIF16B [Ooceraea biroi]